MTFRYTMTEYDVDGERVHLEDGEVHEDDDLEAAALRLVMQWVPVDGTTETWRVEVYGPDRVRAVATGPDNHTELLVPEPLPTPAELAGQLGPLADQLRGLVTRDLLDEDVPAVQQLLVRLAEVASAVRAALATATDPRDTGRHNLEAVQSGAHRLAVTAARALGEQHHPAP